MCALANQAPTSWWVYIHVSDLSITCDDSGSSFVHGISTVDGSYIPGSSFGKLGEGTANTPGSTDVTWNTNHGIGLNPEKNLLLHCDRVGHRLVYTEVLIFCKIIILEQGNNVPLEHSSWNIWGAFVVITNDSNG